MGFVDLHSHVLPHLDDGAKDAEMSMTMLRGLLAAGFDTVAATPHQKFGQLFPSREAIEASYTATRQAITEQSLDLRLPLAAENMWDSKFYERSQTDSIPGYGDTKVFLVEFQVSLLPINLLDELFAFRRKGKLPVLAHPERYEPLWRDPAMVEKLQQNCAMVVDLGAVAGYHGRQRNKVARAMLKQGIAHAAASDAHSPEDVRNAAIGIEWIRKKLGARAVDRLLDENPRRILAGQHPDM